LLGHHPALVQGPERTFDDEVDRIAREIRRERVPVDLIGYSLGARTALGLLVRHPELVRRAALIGPNPGLESDAARVERAAADARWIRLLEEGGICEFVDRWEALPLFATQTSLPLHALEAQRRERLAHDPRGLARSLGVTGLAAMPNLWPALADLVTPVTWVTGALDAKFLALAERAAALCPKASRVVVEEAGHNVPLEQPARLASVVDEALR
jgi:2-succinyl-6-hydroxy-2,4-cyclohexadiene-1-carboxylate synthase